MNLETVGIGGLIAAIAVGTMATSTPQDGPNIKVERQRMQSAVVLAEQRDKGAEEMSEIAQRRLESGCTFYYRKSAVQLPEHKAAGRITVDLLPVVEGDTPRTDSGSVFPVGTCLADSRTGATGMIDGNGQVINVAVYRGDTRPYLQAFWQSRFGFKL